MPIRGLENTPGTSLSRTYLRSARFSPLLTTHFVLTNIHQLYYVTQLLYVSIQNIVKISILLLYLRIFPKKSFRTATKCMLAFQLCHTAAFLLATALQCIPVSTIWTQDENAKCVNSTALVFAGGGLTILEDLVIIALPISELRRLKLSLKKRIALILTFAMGSL